MTLKITTKVVSNFEQNARILTDTNTGKVCMVDPGVSIEALIDLANPKQNHIESIFLTHCHIDHAGEVMYGLSLFEKMGLPMPKLYYHLEDRPVGRAIEQYVWMATEQTHFQNLKDADHWLEHGDHFSVGAYQGHVLHTPGHAPGHLGLVFENHDVLLEGDFAESVSSNTVLISGDALFNGSIGRTDLPGGDHPTLLRSIATQLYTLPNDTLVLPGHGRNTSIGREKQFNPFSPEIFMHA